MTSKFYYIYIILVIDKRQSLEGSLCIKVYKANFYVLFVLFSFLSFNLSLKVFCSMVYELNYNIQ